MSTPAALLEVRELSVGFPAARSAPVLDRVSFELRAGETLVLLGESGSGKSLTALSLLGLLPPGAAVLGGSARLGDTALLELSPRALRAVRGRRIGMVFQEPQSALNPVMRVGEQIAEVLRQHLGQRARQARQAAVALLEAVGIDQPARRFQDYPHQFSGGMKQRALIAMAIAAGPELLVADEPTTALDVTVQAQVLELLRRLREQRGMALLLVTHDLAVAHRLADRVAVLHQGRIVEQAAAERFFAAPVHPCSRRLFRLQGARPASPERAAASPAPALLEVRDLRVEYRRRAGLLRRAGAPLRAVDGVSFDLAAGETVAVVGESGCGKSSLARAVLRLSDSGGGSLRLEGEDLGAARGADLRRLRRGLQMVFQDPYASMNPRLRVGAIVEEGMRAHGLGADGQERAERVRALLGQVGLEPALAERYPHELSGGQRQRVCIARALAVQPRVLVCDEPTSALDASVRAQVLALLRELQRTQGLACLLITHDFSVVEQMADRVLVMSAGRIVEQGPAAEVLERPSHPCTRSLLEAVPRLPAAARVFS